MIDAKELYKKSWDIVVSNFCNDELTETECEVLTHAEMTMLLFDQVVSMATAHMKKELKKELLLIFMRQLCAIGKTSERGEIE